MNKESLSITEKNGNLILTLTLPKFVPRSGQYMPKDSPKDRMHNITGLLDQRTGEFGFAQMIDMSYKGKEDQYTDFFFRADHFLDELEDFEKICREYGLNLIRTTSYNDFPDLEPMSEEEHDYYMNLPEKD